MTKKRVYSGTPWEAEVSYCRALRVKDRIFVSGTTATDHEGSIIGVGNMQEQCIYIFKKIEQALHSLDASMQDIVRTRMFVTDIDQFAEMAKVHHDFLKGIDPTATCVEVSRLVHPDLLIEIEVEAMN